MITEDQYIKQVASIIDSTHSELEAVNKIADIQLPNDANPLLALIHGDSEEAGYENELQTYEDTPETEDELKEATEATASRSLVKIKRYLKDWENGDTYRYKFGLKASYSMYTEANDKTDYIKITKSCDAITAIDAVAAAKVWDRELLRKIRIYPVQEREFLHISTVPTYEVIDIDMLKVASGSLNGEGDSGVSTWMNVS